MQYHSATNTKFSPDDREDNAELRMGRRRWRERSKPGMWEIGPATGERFRLIRPRVPVRKRNCKSPLIPPPERMVETPPPPSFVGGGVSGRTRYLIDSILHLTRDRIIVVLFLVVLMLYLIIKVLARANSITQEALSVYRDMKEAQFAPVKFLVDVLDQFVGTGAESASTPVILNRVTHVLRRNAHMLDATIRAVIPTAMPFINHIVQAAFA